MSWTEFFLIILACISCAVLLPFILNPPQSDREIAEQVLAVHLGRIPAVLPRNPTEEQLKLYAKSVEKQVEREFNTENEQILKFRQEFELYMIEKFTEEYGSPPRFLETKKP